MEQDLHHRHDCFRLKVSLMKHRALTLVVSTFMLCITSSGSNPEPVVRVTVRGASQQLARMMHPALPLSRRDQMLTLLLSAGLMALQLRRQHEALTAKRLSI